MREHVEQNVMKNRVSLLGSAATLLVLVPSVSGCQLAFGDFTMEKEGPVVTCKVLRRECLGRSAANTCQSFEGVRSEFFATTCRISTAAESGDAACKRAFCTNDAGTFATADCEATATPNPANIASTVGICQPAPQETGYASVTVATRYRTCAPAANGVACGIVGAAVQPTTSGPYGCIQVNAYSALAQLQPPTSAEMTNPSAYITSFKLNDPQCINGNSPQNFSFVRGPFATLTAQGAAVPITVAQGTATVETGCTDTGTSTPSVTVSGDIVVESAGGGTSDPPAICNKRLQNLDMAFDDVSVGSVALTGLTAHSVFAAPLVPTASGHEIPAKALTLALTGAVNSVKSSLVVTNSG